MIQPWRPQASQQCHEFENGLNFASVSRLATSSEPTGRLARIRSLTPIEQVESFD